jgi:hypothetical protein
MNQQEQARCSEPALSGDEARRGLRQLLGRLAEEIAKKWAKDQQAREESPAVNLTCAVEPGHY